MSRRLSAWLVCVGFASATTLAFGQASATGSISGTVTDVTGGVIPGATVVVTDIATGATHQSVTAESGTFAVPALNPGTYSVTVSLAGFKTFVTRDVRVFPGTYASVTATLEVGDLHQTIVVRNSSELVNTQTATVLDTLNSDWILRVPTPTRNALNAVTFLPGVNTTSTARNANVNGLPDYFVNITLDGVSNNDNFARYTDGFFAFVTPRQDAVEAVTVTSAVGGASVGGSGSVAINFTTRSGTNAVTGSAYDYYRTPGFNTNYWFNTRSNLPKNDITLNQFGARVGGPIRLPGFDGRDRAFFFIHYEQIRFPNSFTRTRNVLTSRATDGWFRYTVGGEIREVNVLQLAATRGQNATVDPTVASLLARITAATQSKGLVLPTSDPIVDSYTWQSPGRLLEQQPTVRLDYNLTSKHRLSGSSQAVWERRGPDYQAGADPRFPGATNYQDYRSTRPLTSVALRSVLSPNVVSELRGGITGNGGGSYSGSPDQLSNGVTSFADQGGYAIDFDSNIGLTNWWTNNSPTWRNVVTYSLDESLTWQRGTHSVNVGGAYLSSSGWENAQQIVPGVNLGFDSTLDPAAGLFTTANFPAASSTQLSDARDLYALLTGRVLSVTSQAALDSRSNRYVDLGPRTRAGRISLYSLFAQDSWRATPALTLTFGLRWDVQLPFSANNSIMSTVTLEDACGISGLGAGGQYSRCNFFEIGASGGKVPAFSRLTKDTLAYRTDWNNFAPSLSIAWRPGAQRGWLRALLGDPQQATLRGGYSVSYSRVGLSEWLGSFGANPGSTINTTRSASSGDPLVLPGQSWPVFLSQRDRLYTGSFPAEATFPIPVLPNRGSSLNGFAYNLQIPYARTWTVGFQRALSSDMAFEARYVGTWGVKQWSALSYNTIRPERLLKSGFLDEFRLAMANLQANNTAGGSRLGSFAYFGPGTGTSPLPFYLAYLNGRTDATNQVAYTGGNQTWTNTALASRLSIANPDPAGAARDLDSTVARRANALAAGLPANFFVINPAVSSVNLMDNGLYSNYHALQLELRRRLSKGLSANINYQYALEGGATFDGFSFGRVTSPVANVRHAIKTQWDWSVPVGRGRRFGGSLGRTANAILGGWSVSGVGRVQARMVDFGNVRLVGMTKEDLQKMYKHEIRISPDTGLRTVYMLPDDVIQNTRAAFSVGTTTLNGYSESLGAPQGRYIAPANSRDCIQIRSNDCAPRNLLIRAPWFSRFDVGVTKRVPFRGSANVEIRLDMLNLFNTINFNTASSPGNSATIFQVTSAYQDPSNTYDPGGRLGQLMFRLNW